MTELNLSNCANNGCFDNKVIFLDNAQLFDGLCLDVIRTRFVVAAYSPGTDLLQKKVITKAEADGMSFNFFFSPEGSKKTIGKITTQHIVV